ncbi:hypothetical protein [Spirulina sp. 06S082]|nr:hypothetical protein [Spirulina sp. 06S082]MEA5469918.1 hypothetical protein [Spirulina sp. 06S082]
MYSRFISDRAIANQVAIANRVFKDCSERRQPSEQIDYSVG